MRAATRVALIVTALNMLLRLYLVGKWYIPSLRYRFDFVNILEIEAAGDFVFLASLAYYFLALYKRQKS